MNNVDDFYPLTPMQQGVLFHSLYAPESGAYHDQTTCLLHDMLDEEAFQRAWQLVVERHEVLRTFFVWEGLKEPVQAVRAKATIPFAQLDWRELGHEEQANRLRDYMAQDQRRGFDFTEAPLMRVAVVRLTDRIHWLMWSYHHTVVDGWSVPMIFQEVVECYEAIRSGKRVERIQRRRFRDYVTWLQQQNCTEGETYWRDALKGFHVPTPLPEMASQDASLAKTPAYDEDRTRLSEELSQALNQFARKLRLTVNTLLQGAWSLLLSRYSGEEDVVYGTTVSARPATLAGSDAMIGVLINTIPARMHVPANKPLLPWLQQIQKSLLNSRRYDTIPPMQIQRASECERELFESVLVFQNVPDTDFLHHRSKHLKVSRGRYDSRTNYPLTIMLSPGRRVRLRFIYDTSRFDGAAIRRMVGHYVTALEGMIADEHRQLCEIPLLSSDERQQLLVEWNATAEDFSSSQCIHQLVEAQAARTPDAVAVEFQGKQLTYSELDRRANQLARQLISLGVGPEVLVGLYVERSEAMVVALLSILKAGGAYVPLDPSFPSSRLEFMVADSGIRVLLSQHSLREQLPHCSGQVLMLDTDWDCIQKQSDAPVQSRVTPSNLAYVIYTSGSTGKPKGVEIIHRGAVNLLESMSHEPGVTADDTILTVSTLSFDISVPEIFSPLIVGGRVAIASRETASDPIELQKAIRESGATVLQATPVTWRMLLDAGWMGEKRLSAVCGGEAMSRDLANALVERVGTLWNVYGPTETTVWSSVHRVVAGEGDVPIGRPIRNTSFYILDSQLQPTPVGVAGELFIGGEGLARGYRNRQELTTEKFISHPFSRKENARLYRTGDQARYRPDGTIDFLGRGDRQIKLRGFRIELGDIESALMTHPRVRNAVVLLREDSPGDKRLVAYIVGGDGSPIPPSECRDHLKQRLPDYMVPAAFILLSEFPLTPNGKIDRKSFPKPSESEPEHDPTSVPPSTPLECLIAEIWQEILGSRVVGVGSNFFASGGNSLLATRLLSRLRAIFGFTVPLRSFFEQPSIEGLVMTLTNISGSLKDVEAIAETWAEVQQLSPEEISSLMSRSA